LSTHRWTLAGVGPSLLDAKSEKGSGGCYPWMVWGGCFGVFNGHIFFTPFFPSLSFFYTGEKMSTKQRVDGEEKTMGRIREEKTMGKEWGCSKQN